MTCHEVKLGDVVWFIAYDENRIPTLVGPAVVVAGRNNTLRAYCEAVDRSRRIESLSDPQQSGIFIEETTAREVLLALLELEIKQHTQMAALCTQRAKDLLNEVLSKS